MIHAKIRVLVVTGRTLEYEKISDVAGRDRKYQYEIHRAEDAAQAIGKAGREQFEICILDANDVFGVVPEGLRPAILLLDTAQYGFVPDQNAVDFLYSSTLTPEIFSRVIGYALERKRLQDRIDTLSYYDSLTQLPNESLFLNYFDFYFENAKRKGRILALLILDIDNLKEFNNTYGQAGGDLILKEVAARLQSYVRKIDPVSRTSLEKGAAHLARVGGDEFSIVLGELRNCFDASRVAARILRMLQNPIPIEDRTAVISANIGIALYPQDGASLQLLKTYAIEALLTAKKSGKNTFHHFDKTMQLHSVERLDLESEIREVLDNDEFLLYYQPQLDLKTFTVTSMEAFLRLKRKDGKILAASRFIYLIEEMNLMNDVAEMVMHKACRQLKEWSAKGIKLPVISINLAPRQIGQKNFLKKLFDIVNGYDLPIGAFTFEITEQSLEEENNAVRILRELEGAGFHVLIDDFGTGSSTLNNLRFLPVEGIKIDQSFMKPLTREAKDGAIVRSIIDLGRFLNMDVIAKRVEKAEQLVFLRQANCDMAQGDFICHPLPAGEIERLLLNEGGSDSLGNTVQAKL